MDIVYAMPGQPHRLFVNPVHACPNRCTFCVDFHADTFFGFDLKHGRPAPSPDLAEAVLRHSTIADVEEIYFCGVGEPLLRYDAVVQAATALRASLPDVMLAINTSGTHYRRERRLDFVDVFDLVQVSLNAESSEKYDALCRPRFEGAFRTVLEFLEAATARIRDTSSHCRMELSIIDFRRADELLGQLAPPAEALPSPSACEDIARSLGWPLKIKPLMDDFGAQTWKPFADGVRLQEQQDNPAAQI